MEKELESLLCPLIFFFPCFLGISSQEGKEIMECEWIT